jgi:hypothetical protein
MDASALQFEFSKYYTASNFSFWREECHFQSHSARNPALGAAQRNLRSRR